MKKLPITPKSRIRACLRRLFLYSRERANVLRRARAFPSKYLCSKCNRLHDIERVRVHHVAGISNWETIFQTVREMLLNEKDMVVLCRECHEKEHHVAKD